MKTKTYPTSVKAAPTEASIVGDPKNPPPDTSEWLSRTASADWLGVSTQTLRNYERRGKLHPEFVYRPDSHGHVRRMGVYDPKEIQKLPRSTVRTLPREPGEIAARCFELLGQGKTLEEIVIELHVVPETIETLREKWLDARGSQIVVVPAAKAALEQLVGPFADIADLVERVSALKAACSST